MRILPVALISGAALFAACRVEVPDVPEQRRLAELGVFNAGVPAWVNTSAAPGFAQRASAGGLAPEVFTVPTAVRVEPAVQEVVRPAAGPTPSPTPASSLERIDATCPGLEKDINEALTTAERDQRIARYEALVSRCPESADLQVWLGDDYAKLGRTAEAKRAYDQALILDGRNEQAQKALDELRLRPFTPDAAVVAPQAAE